jgi:hypothetical protein
LVKSRQCTLNVTPDIDMEVKSCHQVCSALLDDEGHVNLFGVQCCGYSPTLTDGKAVINNHFYENQVGQWKEGLATAV